MPEEKLATLPIHLGEHFVKRALSGEAGEMKKVALAAAKGGSRMIEKHAMSAVKEAVSRKIANGAPEDMIENVGKQVVVNQMQAHKPAMHQDMSEFLAHRLIVPQGKTLPKFEDEIRALIFKHHPTYGSEFFESAKKILKAHTRCNDEVHKNAKRMINGHLHEINQSAVTSVEALTNQRRTSPDELINSVQPRPVTVRTDAVPQRPSYSIPSYTDFLERGRHRSTNSDSRSTSNLPPPTSNVPVITSKLRQQGVIAPQYTSTAGKIANMSQRLQNAFRVADQAYTNLHSGIFGARTAIAEIPALGRGIQGIIAEGSVRRSERKLEWITRVNREKSLQEERIRGLRSRTARNRSEIAEMKVRYRKGNHYPSSRQQQPFPSWNTPMQQPPRDVVMAHWNATGGSGGGDWKDQSRYHQPYYSNDNGYRDLLHPDMTNLPTAPPPYSALPVPAY